MEEVFITYFNNNTAYSKFFERLSKELGAMLKAKGVNAFISECTASDADVRKKLGNARLLILVGDQKDAMKSKGIWGSFPGHIITVMTGKDANYPDKLKYIQNYSPEDKNSAVDKALRILGRQ